MKKSVRIIALTLTVLMLFGCMPAVFSFAATSAYEQELLDMGFPQSYVTRLSALHDLHPNWRFEPVLITSYDPAFTFDYVTNMENRASGNTYYNLVTTGSYAPAPWNTLGNANYSPYYDASNTNLYDSGWRKASLEAIRYFMDPRNFLNDKDIFMFETLNYNAVLQTPERVGIALSGSFMGNNAMCDNNKTYAQYIWECGAANNISPVFLAARLKQEQGNGTSPLVNATLGTTLYNYYVNKPTNDGSSPVWGSVQPTDTFDTNELLSYDGYYNFFNINAAGTGRFAIFLNAAKEAKSSGWTTRALAIAGGAQKIAQKYVGDYQDTLYFQKFNVDPRSSRTLWGQYMQNIGAPLTEGRNTRNTYAADGILDEAYLFRIPVYEGMPESPCADPAGNNSYYSPSANTVYEASSQTGTTTYKVQCGVFSVRSNADALSASLTNAGYSNYIEQVGTEYVIYAGAYSVLANAQAQVNNIKNSGFDATIATFTTGPVAYRSALQIASGKGVVKFADNTAVTYAESGTAVTYTVTPDSGWRVASITLDGSPVAVAKNGAAATYSYTATTSARTVSVTFELDTPTEEFALIDGSTFTLSGGFLYVPVGTTAQQIAAQFTSDVTLSTGKPATGTTVSNGAGSAVIVMKGDLNGNGKIDSNDYFLLRCCILKTGNWENYAITTAGGLAADLNGNGKFDSSDYLNLRKQLLGIA